MLVPSYSVTNSILVSTLSRLLTRYGAIGRGTAVLATQNLNAATLKDKRQNSFIDGNEILGEPLDRYQVQNCKTDWTRTEIVPAFDTESRGTPVLGSRGLRGTIFLATTDRLSAFGDAESRGAPVLGSQQLKGRRLLKLHRLHGTCSSNLPGFGHSGGNPCVILERGLHSIPARFGTMGGQQSKSKAGAVQGINFSPRQESRSAYSSAAGGDSAAPPSDMGPPNETVACKVDELADGDMKEVKVGEGSVLLVKEKGKFYAVSNKCSHYGAPLSKGAYCNGVVRCPWHGACFSVKTGDIEDFPGLDSLYSFDVEVRGSEVVIKADPEAVKNAKRVKPMSKTDPANKQTFVIVGGGAATVACAETLRQEGFTGRIVVLTKENCLPYDRPKLSKAMTSTAESIALRSQDFYKSGDIDFRTGTEVTGVDTAKKEVMTAAGPLPYDALLIATGGKPRVFPIPGVDLENVCVLRTPDDANRIAANSEGKKVVIIGSSFIGLEAAVYLHKNAQSVTVVGRSKVPLEHVFGTQIGAAIAKLHESKGVKFYMERGIKEFRGENGKLTHAVLSDDTVLEADLCVLGMGVAPATDFLKDSGLEISPPGFITVDKQMKTNQPGVFAAGDIVKFPLFINDNQPSNIQHWQMAHKHGRVAALNMLGKNVDIRSVPYFWTVMYGKSLRYTGYGPGYDDIVTHGDVDGLQFAAFYTKGDKVVAVASLAFDPIVSQAASLMEQGQVILKSEIMDDPRSWVGRLKQT